MFENAPKFIERHFRNLDFTMKIPEKRYYALAILTIDYYLKSDFDTINGDFWLLKSRISKGINWEYIARITQTASMLFSLRNEPGFDEICRRISMRDLRQAYSELVAAGIFYQHGFSVCAGPEIGELTKDFDFTAKKSGEVVSVEVWMPDNEVLDEKNLIRRLNDKRKQLPPNTPGVIFCFYPVSWYRNCPELEQCLEESALKFLRNTKRINAIFFGYELFDADPCSGGGSIGIKAFSVHNRNVRHISPLTTEALQKGPFNQNAIEEFMRGPKNKYTLQAQDEFHQWANWLCQAEPISTKQASKITK